MSFAPSAAQLERTPLRPLVGIARRIWRWAFGRWCQWQTYRMFRERAALVLASPDWALIPKVAGAGRVHRGTQLMHNRLRVRVGSYYGPASVPFFRKTAGVHEPQEERAFALVLPCLPPNAVMIELGAYWAFYSMWFAQSVPGARCFMIEPEAANLEFGRANFALNGLRGEFHQAWVGENPQAAAFGAVPTISVDGFCAEHGIAHVHLLHADIQGFELGMLRGARRMLGESRVDFLFLSTHGEELHAECRAHLTALSLCLLADVPPRQNYSVDGLIVAARGERSKLPSIHLTPRP